MKYKCLRALMKRRNLDRPYKYANNVLVIDGLCFKEIYKKSGCQFILGGEYDRFANALKNTLSAYIKSGIECYVIFNGAMKADIKTRADIHQKILDRVDSIEPGQSFEYCEPIFVKDVYKEVLNDLKIKHYTCMNDSKQALLSLAKKLKCPVLTNNFEYALYGVSVIPFKSVAFNEDTKSITCTIYFDSICRRWCPLSDDVLSVLLAASDEDSVFYHELLNVFPCRPENYTSSLLHWIRRKSKESAILQLKSHLKEENRRVFIDTVSELRTLFIGSAKLPAVEFFTGSKKTKRQSQLLLNVRDKQFEYDVGIGKVAIPFINLKNIGTLSGSWVVFDKNREDSMLVVTDMALYAQSLLSNSSEITFIGRKHNKSYVIIIKTDKNIQTQNVGGKVKNEDIDRFLNFVTDHLPGFDLKTLQTVPEDCWILLISLIYYNKYVKRDITNLVYSVILSYVLLGPVSDKVGVIKRSNFSVSHGVQNDEKLTETKDNDINTNNANKLSYQQCAQAAYSVIDLFYMKENALKDNFDRDLLHTLAELQYSLQYLNYLNKICGENIKCTEYHKAINCTFIYNLFVALKGESSPGNYIENLLNCLPVYLYFQNILDTYYKCLSLVGIAEIQTILNRY